MRSVFTAAAMACAMVWPMTNLHAEELTIERIYDAPSLAGKTPQSLKVSPDGTRVTFLRGKETDQYQLDLWEYDIASKETRMLVDSKVLLPEEEQLSDAEKAKRERARTASLKGIIEYGFSPDGAKLLFPLNGELFLYDLTADETQQASRVRKLTHKELGFATNTRVSPKGGFGRLHRNQNLWLIELKSDRSIQLTRDGGGLVSNGVAEFIAQEEMGRFDGYWWAPDDSMIAFARVERNAGAGAAPLRDQRRGHHRRRAALSGRGTAECHDPAWRDPHRRCRTRRGREQRRRIGVAAGGGEDPLGRSGRRQRHLPRPRRLVRRQQRAKFPGADAQPAPA